MALGDTDHGVVDESSVGPPERLLDLVLQVLDGDVDLVLGLVELQEGGHLHVDLALRPCDCDQSVQHDRLAALWNCDRHQQLVG